MRQTARVFIVAVADVTESSSVKRFIALNDTVQHMKVELCPKFLMSQLRRPLTYASNHMGATVKCYFYLCACVFVFLY